MELVSEAILFATKAHDGMRRKKGESPYILHPLEAAVIVGSMTDNQEIIAAAVLHDVVEDAGIHIEEIEEKFGKRVKALVECETENKREHLSASDTWQIRKEESLEVLKETTDKAIWMVWIGDKLANMRAIYREWRVDGDAMWQKFNQKDPQKQAWYYCTIAKLTEELSDTDAWKEYNTLTELVFKRRSEQ